MIVGIVRLWDLNDGRFCSFVLLWDFKDGLLMMVEIYEKNLQNFSDGQFCSVYETSMTVVFFSFVPLQDFKDGRFCFVTRV